MPAEAARGALTGDSARSAPRCRGGRGVYVDTPAAMFTHQLSRGYSRSAPRHLPPAAPRTSKNSSRGVTVLGSLLMLSESVRRRPVCRKEMQQLESRSCPPHSETGSAAGTSRHRIGAVAAREGDDTTGTVSRPARRA